jgi:hypothetical protein
MVGGGDALEIALAGELVLVASASRCNPDFEGRGAPWSLAISGDSDAQ